MLMSTVSKRFSDAHRARCDSLGTSVHGDDTGRVTSPCEGSPVTIKDSIVSTAPRLTRRLPAPR